MVKRLPVTASSNAVVLQMARSRTIVRYSGTSDCLMLHDDAVALIDSIQSTTTKHIAVRDCETIEMNIARFDGIRTILSKCL